MLRVANRRVVIVGGGPVALRRCRSLLECGAQVFVVAPKLDPDFAELDITRTQRAFETPDVDGAFLVLAATDDPAVNAAVADAARRAGALVNRADDPAASDLTVPAHGRRGPITLAVDTAAASPTTAMRLRDQFLDSIHPTQIQLLEILATRRAQLRETLTDPQARAALHRQMTSPQASRILEAQGPAALHAWIDERVQIAQQNSDPGIDADHD